MNQKLLVHGALFTVAIVYGLNYTIAKDVLQQQYLTPNAFILLRIGGGGLFLWMIHSLIIKEKMQSKDLVYTAWCAVFGVAINMLCFFQGLKLTSPIHSSLIMTLVPGLVLISSAILIKERIGPYKVIGLILGLGGAALLIINSGSATDQLASIEGDLFILVNAASYSIYLVLVKRLTRKYHPITILKWAFLFGFIMVLPFGGIQLLDAKWSTFPDFIWWEVVYVILGTTVLAYGLNAYALSKVMPSTVGFYIYFQPLVATLVSIGLGHDVLDLAKVFSAVLLFIGVYLLVIKRDVDLNHQAV